MEVVLPRDDEALGPFPATQWSLVEAVRATDPAASRAALSAIVTRYLPALRAYLRLQRHIPPDAANDLLQGFVADKIVERELISEARQSRGKFRTFLLTALQRYLIDRSRAERARSPGASPLPQDDRLEAPQVAAASADAFDRAWARQVIRESLTRMETHCRSWGRTDLWEVLRGRVLGPAFDGAEPTPIEDFMPRFGWTSPSQVSNALATAKRMLQREIRGVIAEYAHDVDEEIRDLHALSQGAFSFLT